MDYQEFVSSVTGFLRESLPCGTKLELIPLEKNNGIIMDGLSVRREGQKVAPTIYLESYYRDYREGRSLRGIYDQILECCEDDSFEEIGRSGFFEDYRRLRDCVFYKLVNAQKNKELLKEVPHLPFLNLAIVFYCLLTDTPMGNATILIRNSHLKLWNVSLGELYRDAKENGERVLPARLQSMSEMIRELSGDDEEIAELGVPMYVLTNSRKTFGAACLLYEGMLKVCADKLSGGFYLLPSSVHEVILIPVSAVENKQELADMVRDINRTQVRSTEVLSDNIYLYSPVSGQLTLVEA